MPFLFFLIIFLASTSWGSAPASPWKVLKKENRGSLAEGALFYSLKLQSTEESEAPEEAHLEALLFKASSFTLEVVDSPSCQKEAAQILAEKEYLAGVNGGYFQPDGTPLGLLMHQKKVIHPQEKARLLSGFLVVTPENLSLMRVEEKIPANASEMVQTGPFLVDHGLPVRGLEARRVARRTFLATDNQGNWLMGVISPVTLAEAGQILMAIGPQFFTTTKIERSLNLDGGSSSALWVNLKPLPFSQEEFGHVRNFLGLRPRGLYSLLN